LKITKVLKEIYSATNKVNLDFLKYYKEYIFAVQQSFATFEMARSLGYPLKQCYEEIRAEREEMISDESIFFEDDDDFFL
jgi:hypothetical protein